MPRWYRPLYLQLLSFGMADGQTSGSVAPQGASPASILARLRARARNLRDSGLADRLARIDAEYVKTKARQVTEADLDTVVERAEAIEARFREEGTLRRLLDDGQLLLQLVRDARRGRYRALPVWTLSAVGVALLYVLNPFDLVPDALPLMGYLDDAAVVSACLSLVEQDLQEYRTWRRARPEEEKITDGDQRGRSAS